MSLSAQQRALYTIVDPRPVFLTFPWTNTRITNYHSINATRPRALWNHAIPCHILICEADLCLPDFKQTFRKFISSLPFGGFQLMTFTYPHAWLSICLRWMSNGTGFLKRLSVKCTISYRFSVWSISIETWLLFLINVSSIVLVYINQLQLFKSNLWYSMYSVSPLNMNHSEFGPKFVMLATHPLEYLTCFGFVCAVTFLGDIFSQISAGEEEQCCCDDGWRKGWRGTIFSLLRSTSQNINQKPLIEPNGILASQAYARFNAFMFRVLIDLGVKYI